MLTEEHMVSKHAGATLSTTTLQDRPALPRTLGVTMGAVCTYHQVPWIFCQGEADCQILNACIDHHRLEGVNLWIVGEADVGNHGPLQPARTRARKNLLTLLNTSCRSFDRAGVGCYYHSVM